MEAKAIAKTLRMTPRKARLVADLVRGKSVSDAFGILRLTPKAACEDVEKVLKSAVSNAVNNNQMNVNTLFIKEIQVTEGPRMTRMLPRAKGRGDVIVKRTCNITVVVAEKE